MEVQEKSRSGTTAIFGESHTDGVSNPLKFFPNDEPCMLTGTTKFFLKQSSTLTDSATLTKSTRQFFQAHLY